MTGTAAPCIDATTLIEIVGEVFAGMFGEDRGRPYVDGPAPALPITGCVTVSGEWQAEVAMSCSTRFLQSAAAELFAIPAEAITEADLRDVIGEFANVIGGNVKSVMPGPSALSLPSTTMSGSDAAATTGPATLAVDLCWWREPIRVSISTSPAPAAPEGDRP